MVAVLGGGRAIARAVGRRSGFSLGRPRHCPVWRSSRPRCERRPPGRRPRRSGRGPLSAGVSDCLDAGWAWHGRGSLRSGFCDARSPLWTGRTLGNNNAHAVWRFCEHRMLASFRLPRCASWLARRMPCLCRLPDCRPICSYCGANLGGPRLCQSRRIRKCTRPDPAILKETFFSCWPGPSR